MKFAKGVQHIGLEGRGISGIGGLRDHTDLIYLYLDDNKISTIGGINDLHSLKELYLNNNLIKCTNDVNFKALRSLVKLGLSKNLIEEMGDNYPVSIRHLHLKENRIVKIQHLERLKNLKRVFLKGNPVMCITRASYDFNVLNKVIHGIDVESLDIVEE